MRTIWIAGGVAVALGCGGAAAAQDTVRPAAVGLEHASADSLKAATRLQWARALMMRGDFGVARRELVRSVRDARAAGLYPGPALWAVANVEHATAPLRAAERLDELAGEAERHGDPVEQARALLAAAVLYQQVGRPEEVRARVERLRPMLRSPHLPEQLRADLLRSIPVR
ncbi:MAG: hypothetical protein AVDCRST_MAG68-630 [uncultured Gemmatimonadetes bacterium]|uniref:MalT-like TPR region domain-containing protein n=1 Tax=uncultured Gemmatimonadota bacterium TaxID=203437 RepID=A0A6J4KF45_9BACT|nr:MAG: hypothetical protein AVDCRST_MAG68-630 [uncultured Gemmatimonadota bacterium]